MAQSLNEASNDSLFQQLQTAKEDTSKVLLMIKIGNVYERHDPDSAIYFYKSAGVLSEKIHYPLGVFKYLSNYTAVLNFQNKFSESLPLNLRSVAVAQSMKDDRRLAMAYNNVAASYYGVSDYENCISYFLKAAGILEKMKDSASLSMLYGNLAGTLSNINQNDKAYHYGSVAINIARMANDKYSLESGLTNLATVLVQLQKWDSALLVLRQSLEISKSLDDKWTSAAAWVSIGGIYQKINRYDLILATTDSAMVAAKAIEDKEAIGKSLGLYAIYYTHVKKFNDAKTYAEKAVVLSRDAGLRELLETSYGLLSDIELALGNITAYHQNRALSDSVSKSIVTDKILKNTQELDARYSLTKKQDEIESLNKEKKIAALVIRQRNLVNWILAIAVLVIASVGFLAYRNIRQKRKLLIADASLQQQRITELEKEKQLLAADAVLQGQEAERSRLAQDLHDGLGGILSSAKHSFNNMKDNYIITAESALAFDKSMAMLDKSISELRVISHNMMPEALMKFGLNTALKDYCNSINQSGAITLAYQSFDMDEDTIAATSASVIYRVIQELINNMLKHANAKTGLLQLIRKDNALSITVEDDGKGFDKELAPAAGGIGLKNIQNRVAYLKGTLDINTGEGKGVSVNIEIPNIAA